MTWRLTVQQRGTDERADALLLAIGSVVAERYIFRCWLRYCACYDASLFCIIISHTPYHHIPYSVSSYPILPIIICHTPYHHIPYSVSSYTIPHIIISHTPYHHIPYYVSSYSKLVVPSLYRENHAYDHSLWWLLGRQSLCSFKRCKSISITSIDVATVLQQETNQVHMAFWYSYM